MGNEMDEARFSDSTIESFVNEGTVWVDAKALTEHMCGVSWNLHDEGFDADAAVIVTIGKWLEACTVNAMVDATLAAVEADGPEVAAQMIMDFVGLKA